MASTIINEAFVYMPADTDDSTPILQARHAFSGRHRLACRERVYDVA